MITASTMDASFLPGSPVTEQKGRLLKSSSVMSPLTQETTLPLKQGRRALSSEISSFTTLQREQSD